ncbi:type IV secretion system protein [Nitratidesulfovibrio liaohensis]|jgi:type IV secretion system protein VirB5|uniref:Type IV secretion system protein n=1 Tax=Nitratidesulfovibrio liaohensis TaxID=2604158 RepID=A0ABY9R4I2_9BACT|nr:type IV secretion system protein [Nitratidesulfovibrio liaohensis]WMW66364.1 type IV secretion system protein [Nitratidesulfovibrio liaohensis]
MNLSGKRQAKGDEATVTSRPKPHEENPFLNARQEWLERNGDDIVRCAQWRTAAFVSFLLLGISLAGNVAQGLQNKLVPYVVNVDNAGRIRAVQRADSATSIPQRVIQAELANIITNWRTVTADIQLQSSMLRKLAAYLSGSGATVIREWFATNDPYTRAKEALVSVEVRGLPLPVSPTSWRVEWLETTRTHEGATQSVAHYAATMTIQLVQPATDAQIALNPGGIKITEIAFSKQL